MPPSMTRVPFKFAGEIIPLDRADVRTRVQFEVNFLLLDARSVLTLWLTEEGRQAWILEEIFEKEGIPREFVWLAPIMSRMKRTKGKGHEGGMWALEKPCSGLNMLSNEWYDDRLDVELSTKCFAARIKEIKGELRTDSWLIAAAAFMTSVGSVKSLMERWNAKSFWDIPFDDNPEVLIPRWIALAAVGSDTQWYGLQFKKPEPLTFDQVTGLLLKKDLPISEIARITGVPARQILQINPKIRPSVGLFPAKVSGKPQTHTIGAPRGKGWILVEGLKKQGFLAPAGKQ